MWCFSCDFTNKPGRHIELNAVTVAEISFECQRILSVCKPYGNKVKVVFLECPFCSIGIWNLTKCGLLDDSAHPSPLLSEFWIRRLINIVIAKECF